MIREAAINDSGRIAEIEVVSSRYAYKNSVSDICLYKDLTVENRIPVYKRWITEKRFDLYVNEDPDTGIIKGMMGIGKCEDEDKKGAFELHFIYVDPDFVRMGAPNLLSGFWKKTEWEGITKKRTTTIVMEKKRYLNGGINGKSDISKAD